MNTLNRLFLIVIALVVGSPVMMAQENKRVEVEQIEKSVIASSENLKLEGSPQDSLQVVTDSLALDSVVVEEPKDRTETIYYDKQWRVIRNKEFASYYRLALYPVDSLAPHYFKTYYMGGGLHSEGTFTRLDERDDHNSVFDGEIVSYHPNGRISKKELFANGKLNGEFSSFFEDGAVNEQTVYQDGVKNGESTVWYKNGLIKEHVFFKNGKQDGILATFDEDGMTCILLPYVEGHAAEYYEKHDVNGNCSRYNVTTEEPVFETPDPADMKTEYNNGVAWHYYNKNGLILGVSNTLVDEEVGKFREIGFFVVNKSLVNVELNPARVEVFSVKKGKSSAFELMTADDYDKKVFKKQKSDKRRELKNKLVVTKEREDNVNANLGAQASSVSGSNIVKNFQNYVIALKNLTGENRMQYADERKTNDLGYLEHTTIHPGEVASAFLYTDDKKVDDLYVRVTINGIPYLYEWKVEKKKK